ncbi:uncharacterized protein TNCV_4596261 [Trichonephila clavipes]|uniref:Uncharacterized protein n=1 Tax=Trichonephila clavipes TaxID=2585209 RepID=A0A8X7BJX0_TRICX|nr:uncharacterized protein TNCV_4596261 [Trichonephila clavipes]
MHVVLELVGRSCHSGPKEILRGQLIEIAMKAPSQILSIISASVQRSEGCGSPVVKVSDHGRHVTSSTPVPLKTGCVGQRCTLNLPRAETSSHWRGVVFKRGGYQLRRHPRHLTMAKNFVVRR